MRLGRLVKPKLTSKGFRVYTPHSIPVNDQGIALGQVAIGAYRRKMRLI